MLAESRRERFLTEFT